MHFSSNNDNKLTFNFIRSSKTFIQYKRSSQSRGINADLCSMNAHLLPSTFFVDSNVIVLLMAWIARTLRAPNVIHDDDWYFPISFFKHRLVASINFRVSSSVCSPSTSLFFNA